jgi:hypothetical protein
VLAVAMEESGIAELINTAQVDRRTWYCYESAAGDAYSVARPEIVAELENEARQALAGILGQGLCVSGDAFCGTKPATRWGGGHRRKPGREGERGAHRKSADNGLNRPCPSPIWIS